MQHGSHTTCVTGPPSSAGERHPDLTPYQGARGFPVGFICRHGNHGGSARIRPRGAEPPPRAPVSAHSCPYHHLVVSYHIVIGHNGNSAWELAVKPAGERRHVSLDRLFYELQDVVSHPHVLRVGSKPDLLDEALGVAQTYVALRLVGPAPSYPVRCPCPIPPAVSPALPYPHTLPVSKGSPKTISYTAAISSRAFCETGR